MAKTAETKGADFEIVPPVDIERAINKSLNRSIALKTKAEDIVAQELEIPQVLPEKINAKVEDLNIKASAAKVKSTENKKDKNKSVKGADLTEKEIPLFTKKETVKTSGESTYSRLIYSLIIVLLFGGGLMVFAKWWQKNHQLNDKNTKVQVLTQHHLGPKKSLLIVRVAGESILLGVTEQNINMLKTLSFIDDEVIEELPNSFDGALENEEHKPEEQKTAPKVTYAPESDLVEDLHKQVSGKLKQLRNI